MHFHRHTFMNRTRIYIVTRSKIKLIFSDHYIRNIFVFSYVKKCVKYNKKSTYIIGNYKYKNNAF